LPAGLLLWGLAVLFGGSANATASSLGWNLIIANVIGYTLHGLFAVGGTLGIERRARAAGSIAVAAYFTPSRPAGWSAASRWSPRSSASSSS
jgi:hypothetical protein